ncbi:dipicolinate synthase subunit DpsA [Fodinisporobacter ferrooxydans]|uniref:Dipicolinate synthase subunit DpsA n=1 Tax=Fodinisporobacter ferrooxydans TaxID=2901836 RepID=A0ABY4CJR7_9BACL|nr:dipicolinate synthase subunit DpsA [Alicyclobacillaceae bacterium MYW30-H2]
MLTGIKVAFVGGDARIIEVIRYMIDKDATVALIGFDEIVKQFQGVDHIKAVTPESFADADVVVLPVAGTDERGVIEANYSPHPIVLTDEHFAAMPKHCKIVTGIARKYLEDACEKYQLSLIKLMELDEVAILNSIPTAEGAIQLAIQHTDITIHGSNSIVLGFGRCGITLSRMLAALGSHVKVGARKPADLARIQEMNLEAFGVGDLALHIGEADMIFNTIPALILNADMLSRMPRSCVVIDIASKPGGTDFRFAERRGIKAILAPSLPGIVAPKTAGQIIAKTLGRLLRKQESSWGNEA